MITEGAALARDFLALEAQHQRLETLQWKSLEQIQCRHAVAEAHRAVSVGSLDRRLQRDERERQWTEERNSTIRERACTYQLQASYPAEMGARAGRSEVAQRLSGSRYSYTMQVEEMSVQWHQALEDQMRKEIKDTQRDAATCQARQKELLEAARRQEELANNLLLEKRRAQEQRLKLYDLDRDVQERQAQLRERLAADRHVVDSQLALMAAPTNTASSSTACALDARTVVPAGFVAPGRVHLPESRALDAPAQAPQPQQGVHHSLSSFGNMRTSGGQQYIAQSNPKLTIRPSGTFVPAKGTRQFEVYQKLKSCELEMQSDLRLLELALPPPGSLHFATHFTERAASQLAPSALYADASPPDSLWQAAAPLPGRADPSQAACHATSERAASQLAPSALRADASPPDSLWQAAAPLLGRADPSQAACHATSELQATCHGNIDISTTSLIPGFGPDPPASQGCLSLDAGEDRLTWLTTLAKEPQFAQTVLTEVEPSGSRTPYFSFEPVGAQAEASPSSARQHDRFGGSGDTQSHTGTRAPLADSLGASSECRDTWSRHSPRDESQGREVLGVIAEGDPADSEAQPVVATKNAGAPSRISDLMVWAQTPTLAMSSNAGMAVSDQRDRVHVSESPSSPESREGSVQPSAIIEDVLEGSVTLDQSGGQKVCGVQLPLESLKVDAKPPVQQSDAETRKTSLLTVEDDVDSGMVALIAEVTASALPLVSVDSPVGAGNLVGATGISTQASHAPQGLPIEPSEFGKSANMESSGEVDMDAWIPMSARGPKVDRQSSSGEPSSAVHEDQVGTSSAAGSHAVPSVSTSSLAPQVTAQPVGIGGALPWESHRSNMNPNKELEHARVSPTRGVFGRPGTSLVSESMSASFTFADGSPQHAAVSQQRMDETTPTSESHVVSGAVEGISSIPPSRTEAATACGANTPCGSIAEVAPKGAAETVGATVSGGFDEQSLDSSRTAESSLNAQSLRKSTASAQASAKRGSVPKIVDELGLGGSSDSDDALKASLEAPSDSLEGSGSFPRAAPKRRGNPLAARGRGRGAGLGGMLRGPGGDGADRGKGPLAGSASSALGGGGTSHGVKGLGLAASLRPKAKAAGASRFGVASAALGGTIDWNQASDLRW